MVKVALISIFILISACAPRNGNQSLLAGKKTPTTEDLARSEGKTLQQYLADTDPNAPPKPVNDYSYLLNYEPEKPRVSALDKLESRQRAKPIFSSERLTLDDLERTYSSIRLTGAEAEKLFSDLEVKNISDKKDGFNVSCQKRNGRATCAIWINQVMGLAVPNQRLMDSIQLEPRNEKSKEAYKVILKNADAEALFSAMQAEPENGIKRGINIGCSESECSLELNLKDGKALPLP